MSGGELRESVALLAEEWRVLALGLGGPVVYGTWVIASGLVLEAGTPALKRAVATTVAGTPIRGLELFALLAWIVLPSLVTVAFVQRQLFNRHDNLANYYRLAEPGVLLVVPGAALVGCLAALVVSGWSLPLTLALLVVAVHFLVRTAAFGHRVYTLSATRTLLGMIAVSALSVVVGLLVRLPAVAARDPRLASRVAAVGVADAVQTWTTVVGVESTLLLRGTLFVPIVLSTCYLLAQTTVAAVAKRRGLPAAPTRRPGQRVPESAQPSAATSATRVVSEADPDVDRTAPSDTEPAQRPDPSDGTDGTDPTADSDTLDEGDDEYTGTRVFTPTDPVPPADGDTPAGADESSSAGPVADESGQTLPDDSGTPSQADDSGTTPDASEGPDDNTFEGTTVDAAGTEGSDTARPLSDVVVDTESERVDDATAGHGGPVVPTFDAAAGDDRRAASGGVDAARLSDERVLPTFDPAHTDSGDDDRPRTDAATVIAETGDDATDTGAADTGASVAAGETGSQNPDGLDCPSCGRHLGNDTDVCYCPGCGTALDTGG